MDIFKDSSVVEQELITYRENGGDKVGISLTVCSSYDGAEIILSEDELLGALNLINQHRQSYEE